MIMVDCQEQVPFACRCGYGCGTEDALQRHLGRFRDDPAHTRSSTGLAVGQLVDGRGMALGTDDPTRQTQGSSRPPPPPFGSGGAASARHPCGEDGAVQELVPEEAVCRFCLDLGSEPLRSVCGCRGSGKWVHISCLRQWMGSAQTLVNHPSEIATEKRHLICSICNEKFRGVRPPSRLELVAGLAHLEPSAIKEGILLCYANVFPIPESEDPSTRFITQNKKKHFESSVYLITAVERRGSDADCGDDAVFGVNLTRGAEAAWAEEEAPVWKTALEVRTGGNLSDKQVESLRDGGVHVELSLGGPIAPARIGSALLISNDEPQGLNVGDVGTLSARALAAAASRRGAAEPEGVELRIMLGKAQWTRSQLLGEIARGSWGVAHGAYQAHQLRAAHCHCRRSGGLWHSLTAEVGRLHWAPQNPMLEDYYRRAQRPLGQRAP